MSLIAFVSIFVESSHADDVLTALSRLDNVEDVFEVTGEFDIVSIVSAPDIEEFRDVLKNRIMKIEGVKSTVTSIVLNPHNGKSPEQRPSTPNAPGVSNRSKVLGDHLPSALAS